MEIYELGPTEPLTSMVDVLLNATVCLNSSVKYLKDHKSISAENAVKAKKLENDMETVYRLNLRDLVRNEDFSYVFRMREVYRHLSNMADKIDLAANVIHSIIVKLVQISSHAKRSYSYSNLSKLWLTYHMKRN